MGVFDFLYKPRPRPNPTSKGTNYRPKGGNIHSLNSYHQQRTTTHLNRSSSLPDDENVVAIRKVSKIGNGAKKQNASKMDFVEYYQQSKNNEDLDDFTRLTRLEIKLDDHMKRYFELTTEMNKIENDLILIRREFHKEYQEYLLKKSNRPTVQLGNKILNKLDHYYSKLEEMRTDPEVLRYEIPSANNEPIDQTNLIQSNEPIQMAYNQQPQLYQQQSQPQALQQQQQSHPHQHHHHYQRPKQQQQQQQQQQQPKIDQSRQSGRHQHNNNVNNLAKSQPDLNQHFALDISAISQPNNGGEVHKAHYAVIDSMQYNSNDTPTTTSSKRFAHHQSTPSIPQSSLPPPPSQPMSPTYSRMSQYTNDGYASSSSPQQSQKHAKLYLNMSMSMHSNHPAIENTFRRIDVLRPRIMMYNAEHKLSSYQKMNQDLSDLITHMDTLDCAGSGQFEQDRNIALCELHNMVGMLERSIQCDDPMCVLCNSFAYKQEVSV